MELNLLSCLKSFFAQELARGVHGRLSSWSIKVLVVQALTW